ncbi:hypothetical protein [Salimicrobium jeotgali]|nr:hypothetical protein [Salimicrobium jeotgali]MBM7697579.1 hypothetical protein [Salimicrobium jeotgali]
MVCRHQDDFVVLVVMLAHHADFRFHAEELGETVGEVVDAIRLCRHYRI